MELEAVVWDKQKGFEEVESKALRGVDVYEKLGPAKDVEDCRKLLRKIEKRLDAPVVSDLRYKSLRIATPFPTSID